MDAIEHKKGKIYYSMGEVTEMFDISPATIRFWESKFDILRPDKNKKGNRLFTPADIDNLKLIYHLVKEKGMTLAGAQKRIKENPEGMSRDMEIADRLLRIRALLLEIREEIGSDGGEVYRDNEPEVLASAEADILPVDEDLVITEEEFTMLDDDPAPDYPAGEPVAELFADPEVAADLSSEKPSDASPKPQIIEQTLF